MRATFHWTKWKNNWNICQSVERIWAESTDKAMRSISQEFPIAVCGTLISSLLTRTQTSVQDSSPWIPRERMCRIMCVHACWSNAGGWHGGGGVRFDVRTLYYLRPHSAGPFRLSSVAWHGRGPGGLSIIESRLLTCQFSALSSHCRCQVGPFALANIDSCTALM